MIPAGYSGYPLTYEGVDGLRIYTALWTHAEKGLFRLHRFIWAS